MSKYTVDGTELTAIADAIREKTGSSEQIEFPDGFETSISEISTVNPVDESRLVACVSVSYNFSSSSSAGGYFITITNGVGTFITNSNYTYISLAFVPLIDLYAYLSTATTSKITLTAGTSYTYVYIYNRQSPNYRTYLHQNNTVILDSGTSTSLSSIKIQKK